LTDNRVFDASLRADDVKGDRSGRRDDRYAFTERDTALEYAAVAALAASSRVLRGLKTPWPQNASRRPSRPGIRAGHPPVRHRNPYVPERRTPGGLGRDRAPDHDG